MAADHAIRPGSRSADPIDQWPMCLAALSGIDKSKGSWRKKISTSFCITDLHVADGLQWNRKSGAFPSMSNGELAP